MIRPADLLAVLADEAPHRLAADVRTQGAQAFALLDSGLGDYARKPAGYQGAGGRR